MMKNRVRKMILSGFFLALAYVLPFLTGQVPKVGSMLCPMHIPVLLCGFICGPLWGLTVGVIAPLFRSITLGMPVLFPSAVCMSLELAVYGLMTGLTYRLLPKKRLFLYCSLLIAMATGRLVWGLAMLICMGIKGGSFGFNAFLAGAVTNALPGIAVQIIIIPLIVAAVKRSAAKNTNN